MKQSRSSSFIPPGMAGLMLEEGRAASTRARARVFTPTLTGLGERSHLARPDIGLEVHVDRHRQRAGARGSPRRHPRRAQLFRRGNYRRRRSARSIAQVVYLDAFVPETASVFDLVAADRRRRWRSGEDRRDGMAPAAFCAAPWETIVRDMWGVTDAATCAGCWNAWADASWESEDPVRRANPAAEKLPRAYIRVGSFQRTFDSMPRWLSGPASGSIGSSASHHPPSPCPRAGGSAVGACVLMSQRRANIGLAEVVAHEEQRVRSHGRRGIGQTVAEIAPAA